MSSELVEIQPSALVFQFKLKEQMSCLIQLTNKTENSVGFKVKTTDRTRRKYCVRPVMGIIKAKGTAGVEVIMQGQSVAPPGLLCNDKFLIQSMILPFGLKEEDITSKMFGKDPSKHIEEKKLKVTLMAPNNALNDIVELSRVSRDVPPDASLQKDDELPTKSERHSSHKVGEMIKKPLSWLLTRVRRYSSCFAHSNRRSSCESLAVPLLNTMAPS